MYEQLLNAAANSGGSNYGSSHIPISGAPVTVNTMGLNLGAILQPLMDGNAQTGGYGVQLLSRLGYANTGQTSKFVADQTYSGASILGGGNSLLPLILIGAGIGVYLFVTRKRG